jgi:hypothetical protein
VRVDPAEVRLVPWSEDDLPLLIRLNAPEMTEHLGGARPAVHAFPSVDNPPSNGICRKVGFELLGEERFEYPKGHRMQCNDWRLLLG